MATPGALILVVAVLVAAAAAVPAAVLPRRGGGWAQATPPSSTETPYTKPTSIPPGMPESCAARPELNDYLMIVSPVTCARFIVCDGFRETEMDCPAGLWFNYEKQYCDWPELSGCDESERPGLPTTAFATATPATDVTGTRPTTTPSPAPDTPSTPLPDTPPPEDSNPSTGYLTATRAQ